MRSSFPRFRAADGVPLQPPAPGFTLTELLIVVAIMALMAVLTLPSLVGMNKAGKFNAAINGLSGALDLARQTAVARNTYVWVALSVPALPADPLSALVVASADGTNPFSSGWSGTVALPDPNYLLVLPPKSYSQCQFIEAGALTPQQIPALPVAGASPQNGLSVAPTFVFGPSSGPRSYTRVIEYSPSGQAYNGLNQVNFIEFGIQPGLAPGAEVGKNVALLRVSFVTGKSTLYRP